MTSTFYPGNLQWFGLAKETTPGTPVAAPTIWVPVDTPKHSPKVTTLTDTALRGTMANQHQQVTGMQYEEMGYKTFMYPSVAYAHLLAMMGKPDAVSGTIDPFTHKTSLYNGNGTDNGQPPTYTLFLYEQGGKVAQIAGASMVDLKFTFKANDWTSLDVLWNGMPAAYITAPTNTPLASPPAPPTGVSISLGGVALSTISDVTIDIKRDTKPIPALTGSAAPFAIYGGAMTVTGSLTAIYQGSTDVNLVDLIANTQPVLTVASLPVGDTTHPLTLQMSKIAYDTADPQGSNSSYQTVQSNFKAIANATDALDSKASPLQAIYLNTAITPL